MSWLIYLYLIRRDVPLRSTVTHSSFLTLTIELIAALSWGSAGCGPAVRIFVVLIGTCAIVVDAALIWRKHGRLLAARWDAVFLCVASRLLSSFGRCRSERSLYAWEPIQCLYGLLAGDSFPPCDDGASSGCAGCSRDRVAFQTAYTPRGLADW